MQQDITRSAMINGLIIGSILSVKFIFSTQDSSLLSFLALMLSISIVFVLYKTTIRFRENECGGLINFRLAFVYIFKIYFYGSIISSLVILMYTKFIDTTFLELQLNQNLKIYDMLKFELDDSTINTFNTLYKPAPFSLINVFGSLFIGAFWGLVLSGFIKKEKSIFEE